MNEPEIQLAVESLKAVLPDWADEYGCEADWMRYDRVCAHDDDFFCVHRQKHLLELFEATLRKAAKGGT